MLFVVHYRSPLNLSVGLLVGSMYVSTSVLHIPGHSDCNKLHQSELPWQSCNFVWVETVCIE